MTTTLVPLAYAAAVAILGPRLLGGSWQQRSPRLALMLWHAAGLSVLLALVIAGLGCLDTPGQVVEYMRAFIGRGDTGASGVVGLLVPVLMVARLAVVFARLIRAQRGDRARHLEVLTVLGRSARDVEATVIPAETPAAYCVPGTGRIVLTEAAITLLDRSELRAVIAHERAHLAGRHDLVVTWATGLAHAFPGVPIFRALQQATAELVELLADDRAARRESGDSLAGAIAALGLGRARQAAGSSGLGAAGGSVVTRVHRLLEPRRPLPALTRAGGAGAAVSLVLLPILLAALPLVTAACPPVLG
jgi:Zn-dependent protease with chaperone function